MPITTITTPAPETMLTTVKAAADELNLTDEAQYNRLERYIRRATAKILSLTNRYFAESRITETVKAHGRTQLMLERTPLVEIHEVTYDGAEITDYSIDDRGAGTLYRRAGWVWTAGLTAWGTGIEDFPAPNSEEAKYIVDYTAGYQLDSFPDSYTPNADSIELPKDVEDFCLTLVRMLYFARATDPNLKSEKISDYSYTVGSATGGSSFADEQARFVDKWGRVK
jgi:hypothetical protein